GLWPGLLLAVRHNQCLQQNRIRIFESGLGFSQDGASLHQGVLLAGVITGTLTPEQWGIKSQLVDFFDAKGDVEALGLHRLGAVVFVAAEHPALHPGKTAKILCNDQPVGWLGAIHPEVQKQLDLPTETLAFELNISALARGTLPVFQPLSKFLPLRRDIAIIIDKNISSSKVLDCIKAQRQEILQDVLLFDVYDKGLDPAKRSLAIGLILHGLDHTLGDAEINSAVSDVLRNLQDSFGAILRA
ncbi:hypothetical protein TI04_12830, partial [Achromatium sp. WMS2]